MAPVETRTKWPTCSSKGCNHEIYYRPEQRTVCAACELRGGPPPPKPEPARERTDGDRVKAYLSRMTDEERKYHVTNLAKFNPGMSEQWRQWWDELAAEENR